MGCCDPNYKGGRIFLAFIRIFGKEAPPNVSKQPLQFCSFDVTTVLCDSQRKRAPDVMHVSTSRLRGSLDSRLPSEVLLHSRLTSEVLLRGFRSRPVHCFKRHVQTRRFLFHSVGCE